MSWSRRALLALPLLPLLSGCGFHPMYSEEEAEIVDPVLAAVSVLPIPNRDGQKLSFLLREKLNPDGVSAKKIYELQVTMSLTRLDLGIQRDATSIRGRIDLRAAIALRDINTHRVLYSSNAYSSSDFSILEDAYAAQVGEDDARERTLRDMSNEIRLRLAIFLRKQKPGAA
jgi:LPS-assembly lipoprotein